MDIPLVPLDAISCPSSSNCSAAGTLEDGSEFIEPFVVSEKDGTWGKAKESPGITTLNVDTLAAVNSLSCSSAGNCVVVGSYTDGADHEQAFLEDETGGKWQNAEEVPGTKTLNRAGYASTNSVSCTSTGYCSAVGFFVNGAGQEPFVVGRGDPAG
jgi:hypothetical protein